MYSVSSTIHFKNDAAFEFATVLVSSHRPKNPDHPKKRYKTIYSNSSNQKIGNKNVNIQKVLYGTAESRTFYLTPAGYTADKKTRRKRNRGC